jgi:hypothetical protein
MVAAKKCKNFLTYWQKRPIVSRGKKSEKTQLRCLFRRPRHRIAQDKKHALYTGRKRRVEIKYPVFHKTP